MAWRRSRNVRCWITYPLRKRAAVKINTIFTTSVGGFHMDKEVGWWEMHTDAR